MQRLGMQMARRVFLLAEKFEGSDLLNSRFLDFQVTADALEAKAQNMAVEIASLAPLAVQGMKQTIVEISNNNLDQNAAAARVAAGFASKDHAEALLLVVQKGELGRSYNIGGENEARNIDLVRMICAILDAKRPKAGSYADQITFVTDRPGHDLRYAIEPSRIRDELGWRPSVTLEEGLEKTVQWYLDNEDWWRALQDRQGVGQRLGTG